MEKILRHKHERSAWQRTRLRELEDQGYGIIDGGQTGQDSWDVTDWHTGEVLLSGTGGLHDYDRAVDDADPHGRWLHSDRAFSEDEGKWLIETPAPGDGMPPSLAAALVEWVETATVPDEDIATWIGWTVAEVKQCRDEP